MQAVENPAPPVRLWALPLIAGLLPAFAVAVAYWISAANGLAPSCNPFVDGCVSISRAARHGLANHVFRGLLLPAATLQGLVWLLCVVWLKRLGATGPSLKWLPWLGVLAAGFLVLYGTFLGTEGVAHRWMRRYGVIVYFGFTYLSMLIAAAHIRQLGRARFPIRARPDVALPALLAATLVAGLASVFVPLFLGDESLKDRLENTIEWYAGLAFTLFFAALAWLWRHTAFSASYGIQKSRP